MRRWRLHCSVILRLAAAYLSNVAVEVLAPALGAETYLWIGFRTSNSSSYAQTVDFPYHSLLIQEENTLSQLSFAEDCSSLVELAGGWPGSVACHGGLLQFDGLLRAATWYEVVMRVNISSTAVGPTRLRLLIGRQGSVPLPTESFRSQVEFFETSFGTIETGPAGEYHWPGPELNLTEAVLDIISPRTFLLPSTSFMVRLSLEIPEGSSAPTSFLIMARPFTSWSLHPPAASVIAPGQEDQTASCVNDIRLSPMIDFRCYWTSFGQAEDRGSTVFILSYFCILFYPALPPTTYIYIYNQVGAYN